MDHKDASPDTGLPAAEDAAPAADQSNTSAPPTASPAEPEITPGLASPGERMAVRLMLAGNAEQFAILQAQIKRFEAEHLDITVELVGWPFATFNDDLIMAVERGLVPEVVAVPYNLIVLLLARTPLISIADISGLDEDFLKEGLADASVQGTLYGLPWHRYGCVPYFRHLVLPRSSAQHAAGIELARFLTQPEQQKENFERLRWFPTRQSVYDSLGIGCQPSPPSVYLAPKDVQRAVDEARSRAPNLPAALLDGQTINVYEATAALNSDAILATFTATTDPVPDDISKQQLDGSGLVVGAWFVNIELKTQGRDGAPVGVPPGDYVSKWHGYPPQPFLVSSKGEEILLAFSGLGSSDGPVFQPVVRLVRGSCTVNACIPYTNICSDITIDNIDC
jgi:ABC-type glycerol-3-phosphate transport system substrate-binding protein